MKMLFKQRAFSWLDSYDIYDEEGRTLFTVEGKFSWGHKLHILDPNGEHIATVEQQVFTFLPKFDLYVRGELIGTLVKEFSFFTPSFTLEGTGWHMEGEFMEWDYTLLDEQDRPVATISKELWKFTDTYVIDVPDPRDSLMALLMVLAIDAEKCSRN